MEPSQIRFPVEPGDVPASKAARRLHLTEAQFVDALPDLLARGFPPADPTTGMFDLDAIDEWRKRRHPRLFIDRPSTARNAAAVVGERLKALKHG